MADPPRRRHSAAVNKTRGSACTRLMLQSSGGRCPEINDYLVLWSRVEKAFHESDRQHRDDGLVFVGLWFPVDGIWIDHVAQRDQGAEMMSTDPMVRRSRH